MKERFEPIVIPDAFASEGLGETVVATQPQPGCDVVTISIGDEHVGYTPDEARAIGRALIAAADHIQHDGAGILASEALDLWDLAMTLHEVCYTAGVDDPNKKQEAAWRVAVFINDAKLERFRNRPRTVNYDLPEDNS